MLFHYPAGRVLLRSLTPADVPAFAAYRALPEVARYQGFDAYTLQEAAAFVAENARKSIPPAPGSWVQLAIARASDNELLGDCALHLNGQDPRQGEVGITLAPQWQGQGLAREALRGLLRYCLETLQLHRVLALTDTRNHASVRLLESVGMRREGHFQQNGWFKGEWCDEYQYALLGREWHARQ
ncbi:GNAT family protein [Hymenobacter saemangeumensis]|uniref:GNAT family protein n=1 Tax=Hymenobacter saemangeumensis TaxID=1084522 RepID=A0ABP8ILL0_9BACT